MAHREKNRNSDQDTERFLRLLTPIQGRIYAYILSQWPNRSDADDIMQETTAVIWKKFDNYEPGTDFLAWAVTVAKYTVMSYRKQHYKSPVQFNDAALKVLQDKSDAFFKHFDGRLNALQTCVKKLPRNDSTFLELRYEQELSAPRIANRFDISTRAVYKTLSRIHDVLMRCVRRSLAEEAVS
jgi:RNA polymerase sigma-70 factor (ECF subfamily)